MEKYELTVVMETKITPARKKKVTETVEKIVDILKGKVGKIEDWGEKEGGVYLFFPLELLKSSVKMVSTKLSQEDEVKKYLIVRSE